MESYHMTNMDLLFAVAYTALAVGMARHCRLLRVAQVVICWGDERGECEE